MSPIRFIGFNALMGSWKTMAILCNRSFAHSSSDALSIFRLFIFNIPEFFAGSGVIPNKLKPSIVLPLPLSPTSPNRWPAFTSRLMFLSALTLGNFTVRFSI